MAKKKNGKNGKKKPPHWPGMNAPANANDPWGASFAAAGQPAGMMQRLAGLLGKRPSDQFLLGALVGAAAVYVMSDEKLRGKLIKSGLDLYSSIAGNLAEMKEQMADLQAEVESERHHSP